MCVCEREREHTCLTFLSRLVSLCCGAGLAHASIHVTNTELYQSQHSAVLVASKLWTPHSTIVTINLKLL